MKALSFKGQSPLISLTPMHVCSRSRARHQILATPLMSYHYRVEVLKKNGWNRKTVQDFSSCSDTHVTV